MNQRYLWIPTLALVWALCGPAMDAHGSCYAPQTLRKCKSLSNEAWNVCASSYGYSPWQETWHKTLKKGHSILSRLKSFHNAHSSCASRGWRCRVPKRIPVCEKLMKKFRKQWRRYIKQKAKRGTVKECRAILARNQHPALRMKLPGIQARISGIKSRAAAGRARARARFAARRCPRARYRNRSLRRSIRGLVSRLGGRHGRYSVNIRSYQLMSRPTSPRLYTWRWRQYYAQTFRMTVCLKRKRRGRKLQCRVYYYRLKRVRPVRGRWGPWRLRSMIRVVDVPCKHMP